jgi:hypothetical protein
MRGILEDIGVGNFNRYFTAYKSIFSQVNGARCAGPKFSHDSIFADSFWRGIAHSATVHQSDSLVKRRDGLAGVRVF